MNKLLELCVRNPLNAIGQNGGEIKVGQRASFMLFDPSKKVTVDEKLSLYNGEKLYGEVREIINY